MFSLRTMNVFIKIAGNGTGQVRTQPSEIHCQTHHCSRIDYEKDATGIQCDPNYCHGIFDTVTIVKLIAIPDIGSIFKAWGGHPDCVNNQLWMIGNRLCTAFFERKD